MAIRTRRLLVATLMTAFLTQGCTLIGLGVGSASPKFERIEPPYASLAEGTEVRLLVRPPPRNDSDREARTLDGEYRGANAEFLFLETESGGRALRERDVAEVQRRSGSYWAEGLAVGVALDAVFGTLLVAAIASRPMMSFSVGPWN